MRRGRSGFAESARIWSLSQPMERANVAISGFIDVNIGRSSESG
jgi:hypothetical protein